MSDISRPPMVTIIREWSMVYGVKKYPYLYFYISGKKMDDYDTKR
jgi:hypothetical protein